MTLQSLGALRLQKPVNVAKLPALLTAGNSGKPGQRLFGDPEITSLLSANGPIQSVLKESLPPFSLPVRAILFDKTQGNNWALGWHQDRTIAVKRRCQVANFGPWTVKDGVAHVEPPFSYIEKMITIRLHIDAVDDENGPLKIFPGSHCLGRIAETEYRNVVARLGENTCLAEAGDIWVYATPILHASDKASKPRRRRVLQVDYSACVLPDGLDWQRI